MAKGQGTTKRLKTDNGKTKTKVVATSAKVLWRLSAKKSGGMILTLTTVKRKSSTQTSKKPLAARPTKTRRSKATGRRPVVSIKTVTVRTTVRKERRIVSVSTPTSELSTAFQRAEAKKLQQLLQKYSVTEEESALFIIVKEIISHLPRIMTFVVKEMSRDGIDLEVQILDGGPWSAKQAENGLRITMSENLLGSVDGVWFLGITPLYRVLPKNQEQNINLLKLTETQKARYLNLLKSKIESIVSKQGYKVVIWKEDKFHAIHIDIARRGQSVKQLRDEHKELCHSKELHGKRQILEIMYGHGQ